MKYIIIGGVAGGATAAARIRRNTEKAEIILFEKGEYISYANCGLPYYIGGVIEDRERLFVQTPESFGKRFNIDIRTRSEVTAIDVKKKEVTVRSSGKTYTESYDKLLLSPGASPVRPPLPGIDTEGIFTLRNVNDTDRIKSYMQQKAVKRAVIVGGGFIGLEMAENLHHSGIEVSVVEMANQVMGPIDYSMASLVHEHLQQKGVRLYLEQAVESFEKTAEGISVHFKSGIQVNAEMVLLSIGVRAETRLATEAGLKLGEMRGIYVNEYLQTSDESVYAVGDAIEFPHPITHKPWLNFLAGPANRQARIVADNMVFGNKIKYEGSIGTAIAKVFDLTVASTGLPAKRLKQMNIPYLSATIHSNSHAGYYPGASMLDIKITFSPTDGKLYGAQIVGYDGVDKRIDEYALTIKRNGTVYDLTELEHAYAPPFSSAKDPVALSGYVAGNILSGKMTPLYWRELQQADLKKVTLVDVRTADEYSLGKIPGAINVPLDEMMSTADSFFPDQQKFVEIGFIRLINQRLSHPEISQLHTVYSHRLFLFYRKSLRQEKRFCRQTHFRKQIGSLRTTGFLLSSTKQKGGNSSSLVCRMYKQAVQIAIASYRYKSSNLARRLADSCQEMQIARKQFPPTGRCGTLHPCFHLTRSIIFTASNAYCFFKYRR